MPERYAVSGFSRSGRRVSNQSPASLPRHQKLRLQQAASNFSSRLQFLRNGLWVDRQTHVSPLAGYASGRYPAGYAFPVPFGARPSLLASSSARCGVGPLLRWGYWRLPDHNGVAQFIGLCSGVKTCYRRRLSLVVSEPMLRPLEVLLNADPLTFTPAVQCGNLSHLYPCLALERSAPPRSAVSEPPRWSLG